MKGTKKLVFDLTFLRHGESVGNAENRWQGQFDFPLTDQGRAQVKALAERWLSEGRTFDAVLSSPLSRAKESAEIIGEALGLEVETERVWMERNIGIIAGLTDVEVRRHFPPPDYSTPFDNIGLDGEGDWELYLRAGRALHGLLRRKPGKYLVVSHGGLLNQVMHTIVGITPQGNSSGLRFRFRNASFSQVSFFPESYRWHIETFNDRHHWDGKDSD